MTLIRYKLKTHNTFNVEARISEVESIREWLNTLVNGDTSLYKLSFHSSGQRMNIWFEHDKDAMMFALAHSDLL